MIRNPFREPISEMDEPGIPGSTGLAGEDGSTLPAPSPMGTLASVDASRRRAAGLALVAAGVPPAVLLPFAGASVSWLAAWMDGLMPGDPMAATLLLVFTVCFLAPAMIALPLGAAGAWLARLRRGEGLDVARASAAGTGAAAFLVASGWLLARARSGYELLVSAPLLVGACVFVAVAGGLPFAALGRDRPGRRERVPALYQAMGAGAVNGLLLFGAATAWLALASAFGIPTPEWITGLLPGSVAEIAWFAVALGALAPVTRFAARRLSRLMAGCDRRALAAGLLLPALVPALSNAGFALLNASGAHLQAALGCLLGGLVHLAAVRGGLATGGKRELPALT